LNDVLLEIRRFISLQRLYYVVNISAWETSTSLSAQTSTACSHWRSW